MSALMDPYMSWQLFISSPVSSARVIPAANSIFALVMFDFSPLDLSLEVTWNLFLIRYNLKCGYLMWSQRKNHLLCLLLIDYDCHHLVNFPLSVFSSPLQLRHIFWPRRKAFLVNSYGGLSGDDRPQNLCLLLFPKGLRHICYKNSNLLLKGHVILWTNTAYSAGLGLFVSTKFPDLLQPKISRVLICFAHAIKQGFS